VQREIAGLFRRISSGVHVVGVAAGGQRNAFTAAWLSQVSFRPPLVALGVNPENASYPLLVESAAFTVTVLERGQLELVRRFGLRSGRDGDKLAGVRWRPAATGAPILDDGIAWFDCQVTARHPAGDHELVLGQVVAGAVIRPAAVPMLYADTGDLDGSEALYPDALAG
jgi:flavin reductase (DIM6/NTAB) family NADH-FMN oxidoreductase RutF